MKKIIIMAAAMLFSWQGIQAQNDKAEDNDDVITVTDKDGKQEEIEVPEGLEDHLDSLLHLYNTQAYMMADTSCKYRDVNPVFETQVYIDRLKRLPTLIEMPYNEVVQKFIDRQRQTSSICKLHAGCQQLLHAYLRRSIGSIQPATGAEISAGYRVGTQPQGCFPRRSHRSLAVHAEHRQALWSGGEYPLR